MNKYSVGDLVRYSGNQNYILEGIGKIYQVESIDNAQFYYVSFPGSAWRLSEDSLELVFNS